jgi:hypothetical protein
MVKQPFIDYCWQLAGHTFSLVELVLPMLNNNKRGILTVPLSWKGYPTKLTDVGLP